MDNSIKREKISLTLSQAASIVIPYMWHQLKEQILTVIPVCLYLALFQMVILQHGLERVFWIVCGVWVVVLGLFFFLEGVRIALAPVGEVIGDTLPKRCSRKGVLIFSFVLGIVAAFGEPVIGSLQIAGASVDPSKAPLLHALLVAHPLWLSFTVSLAVGVAVVFGMLRTIFGWSLKPMILPLIGAAICATMAAARDPNLSTAIGLAWDAGAVIVGPVLCPLVLALGLGVFRATGRTEAGMAGFGMVGLISVVPIVAVILLTFFIPQGGWKEAAALGGVAVKSDGVSPLGLAWESFVLAVRAIAPIFLFLWFFMRWGLREEGIPTAQYAVGAIFAVLGLFLFNFGLSTGLSELGNQVGHRLPLAFTPPVESLFPSAIGKVVVVVFGIILGYGATLAEPAFNILGQQVEDVTQGAFKKWLFSQSVAIGVGVGAGLGIVSTVYHVNLLTLLLPPYVLIFILTLMNNEEYVNIAWDGGAVTTGPVTVPLKIAIGIALSHATGFAEGFGILALASAYPVINILLIGLYVKHQQRKLENVSHESK
ncbi:MAG: DUF1538 family protein [Verrucomicrobia bacterium]|nr:DUF1538 family protein [Verrucomicrobiota bacterium]